MGYGRVPRLHRPAPLLYPSRQLDHHPADLRRDRDTRPRIGDSHGQYFPVRPDRRPSPVPGSSANRFSACSAPMHDGPGVRRGQACAIRPSVSQQTNATRPRGIWARGGSRREGGTRMHQPPLTGGARRALVVVGIVFGVAVLSAGVASADGPVQLRSRLGNFCLDTPSGNAFTPTVINPCDGSESQRWNLTTAGQIESAAFPGACLAMPEESWGVHIRPCADWPDSHWNIQPNGQITNVFGACVTVLGGPGPGTLVSTRVCIADAPGQAWDSVS